jgi:outer membrane protein assembly factor BamB
MVEYNTPVLKGGMIYAFSRRGNYFCVNAKTGQAAWTQSSGNTGLNSLPGSNMNTVFASYAAGGGGGMRGSRGGGRGGRGGGMGGSGFGSVVDAGSVLIGLNSSAKLVVFEPSKTEYKEIASYQVSDGQTYAYPVVSGNRIYIKDQVSVAMFTVE